MVSWDNCPAAPYHENDAEITHQVVDRPLHDNNKVINRCANIFIVRLQERQFFCHLSTESFYLQSTFTELSSLLLRSCVGLFMSLFFLLHSHPAQELRNRLEEESIRNLSKKAAFCLNISSV